ncbi:MAG TPA: phosphoribosylglycinamide formyltransferase [Bacteroidetes bacterium]|nr:phosphoribosylglycinamide formyltransferase [Bacteroidota bacterium]HCN38626.1 phosphoribosylglycinamide formyltransferase [Bacteroidota bacterium]
MKIGILASGNGSNFNSIIKKIKSGYLKSEVVLFLTNNQNSKALQTALDNKIYSAVFSNEMWEDSNPEILKLINSFKPDLIVLAGFLKKIPDSIIKKYKNKIINIHPSLLPAFGGKGMYGMNIHKKVIEAGVKVSGLTVHFVNEKFDSGRIIYQKAISVKNDYDYKKLNEVILKEEHKVLPFIIKKFEENKIKINKDKITIED